MQSIRDWLDELGLGEHVETFEREQVDLEAARHLTDEDLVGLGLPLGPRKKILAALPALAKANEREHSPLDDPDHPKGPEAERRQLTVMFCDLVGSTELSERLDPEDLRDVMRAYQEATAGAIKRFGGHIAQTLGDGLMVYFGYPLAHEDDAQRAVAAGLDILAAIENADSEVAMAVRVGIHTGVVVAGEVGEHDTRGELAVVGDTPNIAARVEALAARNTVVLSERTYRLVEPLFTFESLGEQTLRGVEVPMALYRAVAPRSAESRFAAMHPAGLTPFVGRDEEIGLLKGRWARAQEGEGQVVLLCGEPGIGKSRISGTFRELIAGEDHTRIQYQCSPFFTNSAFHPIVQQVEFAAGIAADDGADAKLDKLEAMLAQSSKDLAQVAPFFAAMLSLSTDRYPPLNLSPQRQKELTIEVAVAQIAGLAAERPVAVLFEDVHWIDPTTLEALDSLVGAVATQPVLLIITFRPEFEPTWTGMSHVSLLTLTRLGRQQCAEMIARVADGKPLPEALVEQITDKTDGVPLFIEELTKAVIESDIVTDEGDRYALSGAVDAIAIPDTLHDSLMARLDKLIPVKEVAQIGAAIGREFSYELMTALSPMSQTDLDAALDKLIASELVHRRGTPPNATYVFKHALVQDAAYDSLLRRDRQALHREIAEALIANVPGIEDTEPELLAHHFSAADLAERAMPNWLRAGQLAIVQSSNEEAVGHLLRGLELVSALPEGRPRLEAEIGLQATLGMAYMALKGYAVEETEKTYARAYELCQALGESPHLFTVLYGLYMYHWVRANLYTARDIGAQLLEAANQAEDESLVLVANSMLGNMNWHMGNYHKAIDHLNTALAIYDMETHSGQAEIFGQDLGVVSNIYLGFARSTLGLLPDALAATRDGIQLARDIEHHFSLGFALAIGGITGNVCCAFEETAEWTAECVKMCEEQGFPHWKALAQINLGWARWKIQPEPEHVALLRAGLDGWKGVGASVGLPLFTHYLAQAELDMGNSRQAIALMQPFFGELERSGEHFQDAVVRYTMGDALAAVDATTEAEEQYRDAIETALAQDAKVWQLRAATSLGRLWQSQGRTNEARDLLAPVYDWFTEGLDTADLKEAKALLDELR